MGALQMEYFSAKGANSNLNHEEHKEIVLGGSQSASDLLICSGEYFKWPGKNCFQLFFLRL
jgi:hypothetical protein